MHDVFYLPRFWLFLKKSLLERPAQMFGFTGAMLVALFIYYAIYHGAAHQWLEIQKMTFLMGLVGGGTILASFVFGYFSVNAQGISYLTLPVSLFERWLCAVLITGVLYPGVFLVFFKLVDVAFIEATPGQVQPFPLTGFWARQVYMYFFNYAGAMLLGSLYFNKVGFVKVALTVGLFFIGVYLLNLLIAKLVIPGVSNAFPFDSVEILAARGAGVRETRVLEMPVGAARAFDIILSYVSPAILWGMVYIRLKEKEF